jgi:hypothetical protein
MPEAKKLPAIFAVLRPTSGGSPSYQICIGTQELLTSHTLDHLDEVYQSVKNAPGEFICIREEDNRGEINQVFKARVRNQEHRVEDIRTILWWYLPHKLSYEGFQVPVIDSNRRFFLTHRFTRIVPTNISVEQMEATASQYETIKRRLYPDYRPSVRQGSAARAPTKIPPFVMELLVKNAMEKNEVCSITLQPFSDLSKLGITSCFHLFDYEAIQTWQEEKDSCPTCRSRLAFVQDFTPSST